MFSNLSTSKYDTLLKGAVKIVQMEKGFKVSQDAVLLAASVKAENLSKTTVLDVGLGTAGASLCLLARLPKLQVSGIELQNELADIAVVNAKLNGRKIDITCGDITKTDMSEFSEKFDYVISNPPFFKGQKSPYETLDLAHREIVPLEKWLNFCLRALKPKGMINIIHEASRLADILAYFKNRAGGAEIIPIYSSATGEAIRVIVRAVKGSRAGSKILPGFVMHEKDKSLTLAAKKILEQMGEL